MAEAQDYLFTHLVEAVVLDQIEGAPVGEAGGHPVRQGSRRACDLLPAVPSRNAEGDYIYMSPRDAYRKQGK